MPTLLIVDDDGTTELIRAKLAKKVNAHTATIAILETIAKLDPPRKERSDKGKQREPKLAIQ